VAVASAGPYANRLHLVTVQTDRPNHASTSSPNHSFLMHFPTFY